MYQVVPNQREEARPGPDRCFPFSHLSLPTPLASEAPALLKLFLWFLSLLAPLGLWVFIHATPSAANSLPPNSSDLSSYVHSSEACPDPADLAKAPQVRPHLWPSILASAALSSKILGAGTEPVLSSALS